MKIKNLDLDFLPEPTGRPSGLPGWWVLVFAAASAFLLPRQSAFPYVFQTGQPWNYHALKAPFDFEVLYPEEQVRPAIERVNAEHSPYFLLDPTIGRQQKRRFEQLLEEQVQISGHDAQYDDLRANAGAYLHFGQQMLDLLYARGIVDPNEPAFQATPGYVYVVAGTNENRAAVRELLTVKTANDFLTDTLPYAALRQPELVLPMLEKVLIPNLRYSDSLTTASLHRKLAAAMSTGVTMHRGETIVQRNELVTNDIYLKLQSLARRYEGPKGWEVALGYGLLAALAFGVFFLWLARTYTGPSYAPAARLLLPVLALTGMLGVGFASRAGIAVPLLLPLWAFPVLLRPSYGPTAGIGVWAVVVLLTTIALDWSAGWLVVQVAGLIGALLLLLRSESWRARGIAVVLTALLQIVAGWAAGWAGKLPDALLTVDTPVFLLVAGGFSLLAFPLGHFVARQL